MASYKAQVHSAEHIFWTLLKKLYPAIKTEAMEFRSDQLRLDYRFAGEIDEAKVIKLEKDVNEIIRKKSPVKIEAIPKDKAAKIADLSLLPESVKDVRIVKIGDISTEACAGEHVRNTSEIGDFKVLEIKKRGKDKLRVYITVKEKMKTKKQEKSKVITPKTPKGFRDFFGPDARIRQYVVGIFRNVFEKYGYEPLETPALEYAEVLLGKSGEEMDKMTYIFEDPGKRKVGLKYDMTVPACRFIAENYNQLTFPLKRYQIQLAWRAEKPQKGRFREFMQCDADVWGTKSVLVDAEFIQMGIEICQKLGFKNFVTRINNRKIINGIFAFSGAKKNQFYDIAISIDKLTKIGFEGVKKELKKRKVGNRVAEKVLEVISVEGSSDEKLAALRLKLKDIPEAVEGINEIEKIFVYLETVGVGQKYYFYDPSIIRGMAYYTGPVWEFEIIEGGIGSIAGCGRYDELTSLYLGKDVPASGGSFGLERIIEVMKTRKMVKLDQALAQVLVTVFSPTLWQESAQLAKLLRENDVPAELYLDPEARLERQLKYADKKGIPWLVILGPEEVKNKTATLKNMKTGGQETLPQGKLLEEIKGK